jgi:hypothetical protein
MFAHPRILSISK